MTNTATWFTNLETARLLGFNNKLYMQVEKMLDTKNKALAVLGTGLGKTNLTLAYFFRKNCNPLVIVPNTLIKKGWEKYKPYIDSITYQAFAKKYNKIDYSNYDLIVLDEVHHVGYDKELGKGSTVWGKAIQYLLDKNIKILGLTATPDRSDGIMLGENIFKDCVCEGLSIEEAIEKGIVHPFSYVTALYTDSEIKEEANKFNDKNNKVFNKLYAQLDLALNNRKSLTKIFEEYMPKTPRKGIIFIQSIEELENVKEIIKNSLPNIKYKVLFSSYSKKENEKNRQWFEKTNEGYLIAINMISEGAHYKGVNTIIMFRRTNSYLLYSQQIGRIITLIKDENPGAIVFDLVNNINLIEYNKNKSNKKDENKNPIVIKEALVKVINRKSNSKSTQIIIADETQDIVKRLKQLKKNFSNFWESWEEEIIINNYKQKGVDYCLNLINKKWGFEKRTRTSVMSKADDFNVTGFREYEDWEKEILINNYEEKGIDYCMDLINKKWGFEKRNKYSIKNYIRRNLNVSRRRNFEDWEIQILVDNYELKGADYCLKLINEKWGYEKRDRYSILYKVSKSNICSGKEYRDWEVEIIMNNYEQNDTDYCVKLINEKWGFEKRTKKSVETYAKRTLNLSKRKHLEKWERQIVIDNYKGRNSKECLDLINKQWGFEKRTLNTVREIVKQLKEEN